MIATNTFASLFESSPTPVCASINQKFIYANQAFLDMVGYNIDELPGLPITILTTDENKGVQINRNILREKGEPIPGFYIMPVKRKDGSVIRVYAMTSLMTLDDGIATLLMASPLAAHSLDMDVIDSRFLEIFSLYEEENDYTIILNRDLTILYLNHHVREVISKIYKTEAKPGDSILKYSAINSQDSFLSNCEKAFRGETIIREIPLSYKDGSTYWWRVKYAPIPRKDGKIENILFKSIDISDIVRTKEELRWQNERLNSLFTLMAMEDEEEAKIIDFAIEEVVRLTGSEVAYLHFVETQTDDTVELRLFTWSKSVGGKCQIPETTKYPIASAGVWADCIRTGEPALHNDYQHQEDRKGYPEGHFPVVRHLSVPVFEEGKPKLIFGIGNKPTEYTPADVRDLQIYANELWKVLTKRRTINELRIARDQAEKASRLKSEFLSQMSHEIRSPINVLLGSVEVIKDFAGEEMLHDASFAFDAIDNAGHRIVRSINMILNMSEIQSGNYKPIFKPIDLKPVISRMESEYSMLARQKGLTLAVEEMKGEYPVEADEYSLTQVIGNLLDNAIKYTKTGGVTVKTTKSTGKIFLYISDTGQGISDEYKEVIFSPFRQEEQGYSRNFEGNGLGLALVKRYCEANNVSLGFTSEKGKGTTFTLEFSMPGSIAEKK